MNAHVEPLFALRRLEYLVPSLVCERSWFWRWICRRLGYNHPNPTSSDIITTKPRIDVHDASFPFPLATGGHIRREEKEKAQPSPIYEQRIFHAIQLRVAQQIFNKRVILMWSCSRQGTKPLQFSLFSLLFYWLTMGAKCQSKCSANVSYL